MVKGVFSVFLFSIFLVLLIAGNASALGCERQITYDPAAGDGWNTDPAIYGDDPVIAWVDYYEGSDAGDNINIMACDSALNGSTGGCLNGDAKTVIAADMGIVGNGCYFDPVIYEDRIVWLDSRDGCWNMGIYMHEAGVDGIIGTADDVANKITDDHIIIRNPDIYENRIVWWTVQVDIEIHMYDFGPNGEFDGGGDDVQSILVSSPFANYRYPHIWGDKVAYLSGGMGWDATVYVYEISSGTTTQVTSGAERANFFELDIYEDIIVWEDQDSGQIYMCDWSLNGDPGGGGCFEMDAKTPISAAGNPANSPRIHGNTVTWEENDGGFYRLFSCDLSIAAGSPRACDPGFAEPLAPVTGGGNAEIYEDTVVFSSYPEIFMTDLSMPECIPNCSIAINPSTVASGTSTTVENISYYDYYGSVPEMSIDCDDGDGSDDPAAIACTGRPVGTCPNQSCGPYTADGRVVATITNGVDSCDPWKDVDVPGSVAYDVEVIVDMAKQGGGATSNFTTDNTMDLEVTVKNNAAALGGVDEDMAYLQACPVGDVVLYAEVVDSGAAFVETIFNDACLGDVSGGTAVIENAIIGLSGYAAGDYALNIDVTTPDGGIVSESVPFSVSQGTGIRISIFEMNGKENSVNINATEENVTVNIRVVSSRMASSVVLSSNLPTFDGLILSSLDGLTFTGSVVVDKGTANGLYSVSATADDLTTQVSKGIALTIGSRRSVAVPEISLALVVLTIIGAVFIIQKFS
ncbi:MAG: hypothetical protein ABID38_01655 [Candidatus Diapherotrites archaeon]